MNSDVVQEKAAFPRPRSVEAQSLLGTREPTDEGTLRAALKIDRQNRAEGSQGGKERSEPAHDFVRPMQERIRLERSAWKHDEVVQPGMPREKRGGGRLHHPAQSDPGDGFPQAGE